MTVDPEVALLSAVFKGGRHTASKAADLVAAGDFSTVERQRLWATLLDVIDEHGHADPVVLAVEHGNDTPVSMLSHYGTPLNVGQYAQAVVRNSRHRRVRALAQKLQEDPDRAGTVAAELETEAVSTEGRRFPVLDAGQIEQIDPPEWLVDGMLEAGLVLLYGPSEVGKTFLAVDWALCAVSGHRWFGRDVRQSPVVYVAGEGKHSFGTRQRAWRKDRRASPDGMYLIPQPVNLRHPADAAELTAIVAAKKARLLVVDTWSRCTPGADENSRQDTSEAVAVLDRIRTRHDCAVMVVHHTGHDETRPRGSTDLYASVDTSVRVTETFSGGMKVACDKQKNSPHFDPWTLRLKEVAGSAVLTTMKTNRTREDRGQELIA